MELFEAIHTRMSIGKVKPDPVPRELIEQMLDAGAQAPNHHKVQPWRFIVLTGSAREHLGAVMAQALLRRQPDAPPEIVAAERAKPLRAPVLIAVGVDKPSGPKVEEIENVCAAAAATQNTCWRRMPWAWRPSGAPGRPPASPRSKRSWAWHRTNT